MNTANKKRESRRGIALLMCMFVIAVTSLLLLGILECQRIELETVANSLEFERAQYLTDAGIHEARAKLLANTAWRGSTGWVKIPGSSDGQYLATVESVGGTNVRILAMARVGTVEQQKEVVVDTAKLLGTSGDKDKDKKDKDKK